MSKRYAAGWDIGGANLKLALATLDGNVEQVAVLPCPLWQGLDELRSALRAAPLPPAAQIAGHAVTMTGELCDLFADRRSGVRAIVETATEALAGAAMLFYALDDELLAPPLAIDAWQRVASANWMAGAACAADSVQDGLFIDIGSTTTDIVPLLDGRAAPGATTDAGRLQIDELLYCGVLRTPVMALADRLPWAGAWSGVAAELFATSADVFRLTGDIGPDDDPGAAADGGDKSEAGSARRLARQVGADYDATLLPALQLLARHIADRQCGRLAASADRISSRSPGSLPGTLVGAGVGRFLVRRLAQRLSRPYRDFGELPGMQAPDAAVAAPACVMARKACAAWRAAAS